MYLNRKIILWLLWLLGNAVAFLIKYLVHKNGYETNILWGGLPDLINFRAIIRKEENTLKKYGYRAVLYSFFASVILLMYFVFAG
jgi:hypothetical protein